MKDYREKVRKLLALAESDNEFEAKAALLKAKELMAEHKLSEDDLANLKTRKVVVKHTGFYYTMRGEWWMGALANVIGENYCCRAANYIARRRAQKREIEFIGLEDDIELCVSVFEYAVNTVRRLAKEHVKNVTDCDIKIATQSYCAGFADGVKRAFEEQKNQMEEGWGLVMVIPKEVDDYCAGFGHRRTAPRRVYDKSMSAGYTDGKRFNPAKCLA